MPLDKGTLALQGCHGDGQRWSGGGLLGSSQDAWGGAFVLSSSDSWLTVFLCDITKVPQ